MIQYEVTFTYKIFVLAIDDEDALASARIKFDDERPRAMEFRIELKPEDCPF